MMTLHLFGLVGGMAAGAVVQETVTPKELAATLNSHASVDIAQEDQCWSILASPIRAMSTPPDSLEGVSAVDVFPSMPGWDEVIAWANQQQGLAKSVEDSAQKPAFGLRYGREEVDEADLAAGLVVDFGMPDERIKLPEFRYLSELQKLGVWAAAEAWNKSVQGDPESGLRLLLDYIVVMRRVADRQFVQETEVAMDMMSEGLTIVRDIMYAHLDQLSYEFLVQMARYDIPSLKVDANTLFMPKADQILVEALLTNAFDDELGMASEDEFAAVFTEVQAGDDPIERFGARRRWELLQSQQDSLEQAKERAGLIFDDWSLRWRADDLTPVGELILARQSQFELMNVARFAAIDAAIHDMGGLFAKRDRVMMEVNATATAAGLAAYYKHRGKYPPELRVAFGVGIDKKSIHDRHANMAEGSRPWLRYRYLNKAQFIDIGTVRVKLPAGTGLLYSTGLNGVDDAGRLHVDERGRGDLIVWPPPRELLRMAEQGEASDGGPAS